MGSMTLDCGSPDRNSKLVKRQPVVWLEMTCCFRLGAHVSRAMKGSALVMGGAGFWAAMSVRTP